MSQTSHSVFSIWRENRFVLRNDLWMFKKIRLWACLHGWKSKELFKSQMTGPSYLDEKTNKLKMPFMRAYEVNGWFGCDSVKVMNWKNSVSSSVCLRYTPSRNRFLLISIHSTQSHAAGTSSWVFSLSFNHVFFASWLLFNIWKIK